MRTRIRNWPGNFFFVFVETCENTDGKGMNIFSGLFFYEYIKSSVMFGLKVLKTVSMGRDRLLFNTALRANSFIK